MYFDPIEAGKRMRDLRKNLGYTQIQFSEKLNVSRGFYSKVEIGLQSPSIDLLVEIATFTGVSLDYLILGKGHPSMKLKQEVHSLIRSLQMLEDQL